MNIPLSAPDLTHEERACVMDVLLGRELSLGPRLPAFERALREFTGARHAIAVNSGTSALHLCIKAAGIGDGDEVITTPFSFVASANCALFERGVPVFVDIDPTTWNIDISKIEAAITSRTKAILPVHVFGRPCAMEPILEIARRHNLAVIEDSCEAIGATSGGRPVGTFGQTGVFAFYPNKQITTGEGGAIVTNDDEVARLCRSWRNQGRGDASGWLQHERLGYNYRLSDLNCALGSVQVSRLPEILAARASVAARYHETLAGLAPDVVRPELSEPDAAISWFVYVVRLSDEYRAADRDEVVSYLRRNGIGCNTYFSPIHLQPFYREMFGYGPGDFPVTEHIAERTIALPFFNQLKDQEIETVCNALAKALSTLSLSKKAVA
jgi:perosamine synthetase